jgi:hypothetical protein
MQDKNEQRTQHLAMIKQWQQGGLSQKQFCVNNNIRYHVFHYWYRVYKTEQNATSSFLPVNIKPVVRQEQITVTGLNGLQVRVSFSDQAVGFIKQLLLS